MRRLIPAIAMLACMHVAAAQSDGKAPPAARDTSGSSASAPAAAPDSAPDAGKESTATGGWRLATSSSPYLRAHADNPVEWYPWSPEAFARARELDRLVFLSIGYSACHWCHRMEHDTFEDPECARLLNEHFVSIKVDREERPDIDSRYLQALQLITGTGGWPASLFLTPEGEPFAGGTYFAPEETPQTSGFKDLLLGVSDLWRNERQNVLDAAHELQAALLRDPLAEPPAAALAPPIDGSAAGPHEASAGTARQGGFNAQALLDAGVLALAGSLDSESGGSFGAPKFPPPLTLAFLLRQHLRTGLDVLPLVRTTLDAMAGGALQDHVGGGFHRYCVDAAWKVPHFEKMLSDNALLAELYAEAFAITGNPEDAVVARRTLRWMLAELRTPEGLLGTSRDADSLPFDESGTAAPGAHVAEGRVFLWSFGELKAALGDRDGPRFAALFGVTPEGNFEGSRSILRPMRTRDALAADPAPDWPADAPRGDAFTAWLDDCLQRLAAVRARRPQPALDAKAVAAGNGLALSALARAAALLQDAGLAQEARALATTMHARLMSGGPAALHHQVYDGAATGAADLLDYACVARGLVDTAVVAPEDSGVLLARAVALTHALLDHFEEPVLGAFFDTTGSDPHLPGRTRDLWDGATPAGTSVAIELLLLLGPLDDSGRFAEAAQRALSRLAGLVERAPAAFPALLAAVDAARGPLLEVVLDGSDPARAELLAVVQRTPLPAALIVPDARGLAAAFAAQELAEPSLVQDRRAPDGEARAWVCVNRACLLPAATAEALRAQLETAGRR